MAAALLAVSCNCGSKEQSSALNARWTIEQAKEWGDKQPWLAGADYIPANAINQLEMWQAESFDPETISKELELASSIGFNTLRVYLHSLAWEADPQGFKDRLDQFLQICDRNGIRPMLVFFDDCWNPFPKLGEQPAPTPFTHNSGWVQDPGWDAHQNWDAYMPKLEAYVTDVLTSFADDQRILMWDLYNEPGNQGPTARGAERLPAYGNQSLPLVKNVFAWAQKVRPSQPLTMGIWRLNQSDLCAVMAENSDIITYHNYRKIDDHRTMITYMKMLGRPVICTEYMSRGSGSTFADIMPMLKENNIGAINWGFVDGKTQTKFPWDSWEKDYTPEPELWFHDIFRGDLTPYDQAEVDLIKELTGKK